MYSMLVNDVEKYNFVCVVDLQVYNVHVSISWQELEQDRVSGVHSCLPSFYIELGSSVQLV